MPPRKWRLCSSSHFPRESAGVFSARSNSPWKNRQAILKDLRSARHSSDAESYAEEKPSDDEEDF